MSTEGMQRPWAGEGGLDGEGDRWRRGRKFSAEDLQLMLLGRLEEKPSHGYELIRALETMTEGFYKPSPGMVYPALTYLEEIGFATVDVEGNKKRYRLAQPGRDHLDANRDRLMLISKQLAHAARKMAWMRRAWAGEAGQPDAGAAPGDDDTGHGWLREFVDARLALKQALLLRTDAPHGEQLRIAAILRDATARIAGGGAAPAARQHNDRNDED